MREVQSHPEAVRKREYAREHYRRNRDRILAQKKARRAEDPERARQQHRDSRERNGRYRSDLIRKSPPNKRRTLHTLLKRVFGISIEQYEAILRAQDGKCAVCRGGPTGGKTRLVVDHCHVTGKVRGLLCGYCNSALGLMRDNPSIATEAAAYLRKWKTTPEG